MLRIHNGANVYPLQLQPEKKFVTHKLNGIDEMQFEIDSKHELYKFIFEEVIVDDGNNEYIIKHIDEHSDFVTIQCTVNLDDWKAVVHETYRETNITLANAIATVIPNGWSSVGAAQFTRRHTVSGDNNAAIKAETSYQIVERMRDIWGVTFVYNALNKTITCIDIEAYAPSGIFISDEVNLKSIGFVGETRSFATRIYPYGKRDANGENPLTIAEVNDGKIYLEDTTYSNKVISIGWSDERYTVASDLKEAAALKLASVSTPSRSYTCEVRELGVDIQMFMIVTLIDQVRQTRVNHRIVEWKEYEDHLLDQVTLSSTGRDVSDLLAALGKKQEETSNSLVETIEALDEKTRYTALYTMEFGEIVGSGDFYFTRPYTDEPYFMSKPYDENLQVSFIQDEGTHQYIGARLSGKGSSEITLITFYCTMPLSELEV